MTERFETVYFSREHRYWLGVDVTSGAKYLAIPVSNMMVDYHESYWITPEKYESFISDQTAAIAFADECRRREHDKLLIFQPGSDRGMLALSSIEPGGRLRIHTHTAKLGGKSSYGHVRNP
jgi:hypothetical protein